MSPHFVLGRENVPCVEEVVNRSLKADCTDFTLKTVMIRSNSEVFHFRVFGLGYSAKTKPRS